MILKVTTARMILTIYRVSVKYRKALLSVEVTALKEISKGFEERFELDIDQIGCDENRIHILLHFIQNTRLVNFEGSTKVSPLE